jgi:GT2 family glycosyltransferase
VGAARGEWIAFFDDDQRADRSWLAELLRIAKEHGARCVGGAIIVQVEKAPLPAMGPVCRSLLGEHFYAPTPIRFNGHELPSSGNLLVHRSVFDAVGLFDERAHSGEDTEFLTRAREAGFSIWSAPAARVHHVVPRYRTERAYLRWVSYRWGMHYAEIDFARGGYASLLMTSAARLGQALLIHLPHWLSACMRSDPVAALDCQCLLWRAEAYLRCALWHVMPGRHEESAFVRSLEFRAERAKFGAGVNTLQTR